MTCYLAELRQRDRLIDSQVYLKVLNWREVHVVAQNDGDFACPSATLLLASILRVSIIPNPSHTYIPNLPSHMPTASPFISTSTLSTTHVYSIPLISHRADSRRPPEIHSASMSSSRSLSSQNQHLLCNSLNSSFVYQQTFNLFHPG